MALCRERARASIRDRGGSPPATKAQGHEASGAARGTLPLARPEVDVCVGRRRGIAAWQKGPGDPRGTKPILACANRGLARRVAGPARCRPTASTCHRRCRRRRRPALGGENSAHRQLRGRTPCSGSMHAASKGGHHPASAPWRGCRRRSRWRQAGPGDTGCRALHLASQQGRWG